MIIEAIINMGVGLLDVLFGRIEIDLSVAEQFFEKIWEILRMACYLLPMGTVTAILAITIALFNFRIVVAILKTLWGILPLV